jgi:Xaa-Pro aminopeptidase
MSSRADRLLARLAEDELDALLVTDLLDVRYLTGFTGSSGIALLGPRLRAFVTDFRYLQQAAVEVGNDFDRHRATGELLDAVGEVLPEGELRLGFDDASLTVRRHARLRERLPGRVSLIAAGGAVAELRQVKEPSEVEAIAAAAQLADAALAQILADGLIGRSERDVALALEAEMRARGASAPSFDSIVAGGGHGALPHATPRQEAIRRGELVVIDWGARLDGYCSDCTRTVAAGQLADPDAAEVYATVLAAQRSALAALRAGAGGRAVDAVARERIAAAGHGEHFGHGLGHGVGLEVHEPPRLSQRSEDTLRAGNVVTVEPGIYLPGRLGVRIEDLVVVEDGGCRILTGLSTELLVVD